VSIERSCQAKIKRRVAGCGNAVDKTPVDSFFELENLGSALSYLTERTWLTGIMTDLDQD
jgi:hypothetical protein